MDVSTDDYIHKRILFASENVARRVGDILCKGSAVPLQVRCTCKLLGKALKTCYWSRLLSDVLFLLHLLQIVAMSCGNPPVL
jgi:hypothetical protein